MKKLRMILPVAAVVLAVAGAWATQAAETSEFAPVDVSVLNASNCLIVGKCTNTGTQDCIVSETTYAPREGTDPITCSVPAKGTFVPNN
jgi:hypothetical protein